MLDFGFGTDNDGIRGGEDCFGLACSFTCGVSASFAFLLVPLGAVKNSGEHGVISMLRCAADAFGTSPVSRMAFCCRNDGQHDWMAISV